VHAVGNFQALLRVQCTCDSGFFRQSGCSFVSARLPAKDFKLGDCEEHLMTIREAKQYVGKSCWISWIDRLGVEHTKVLQVEELRFEPMYGAYLIGDTDDVSLERVKEIRVS
jgi:hypothetical protein